MGKSGLQKLLAVLLAGTIATSGASALAEKKGKTSTKSATTIEEEVKAPSIDDLCLPEEFIAYLNQNNIQIADGKIDIKSTKDIEIIAEYVQNDWSSKGLPLEKSAIMELVVAFGSPNIDREIIQKLVDENLIIPKFRNYQQEDSAVFDQIIDAMNNIAFSNDYQKGISFLPIILDYKTRQCVKLFEDIISSYIATARSVDSEEFSKKYKKIYLNYFDEVYNFYKSNDSIFPYKMNELSPLAPYIFANLNYCAVVLAFNLTDMRSSALARYVNTKEGLNDSLLVITPYIDNFPQKSVQKKQ